MGAFLVGEPITSRSGMSTPRALARAGKAFERGGVFLLRRKEPALLVLLRQSNSFGLKDEYRERTSKR